MIGRPCALLALVAGATACAASNPELDRRLDEVNQLLIEVEEHGGRQCAPRLLAIAHSHVKFSERERAQGFASRAERHLLTAERHARAAERLSPADRCAPKSPTDGPET